MLKMNNLLKSTIAVIALVGLTACDKFLDKMPDNRAEINSDLRLLDRNLPVLQRIHVGQRGQHG